MEATVGGNGAVRRGSVELICGCMFSGKTTELLRRIRECAPGEVMVIKHGRDDRYGTERVVTHGQDSYPALVVRTAEEIPERVTDRHRVVAVDEGHFFDQGLPGICETLARRGHRVMVTALDLNSWGHPFAVIEALKGVADDCLLTSARCPQCGGPATRTQRLTPIVAGKIVGGPEAFEPRCVQCWSPPPEASVD